MVLRLAPRQLALAVAVVVMATPLPAQSPYGGEVDVVQVRGEKVRGPGGWWQATEVEIAATAAPENASRFLNRVQVRLNLAFDCPSAGEPRFQFYRAEMMAIAVEQGRASFRFYLPPEIVERDRLAAQPRFYWVELQVGDKPMPVRRTHVAPSLPNPEALEQFRQRVAQFAPANDGILQPQAATPFAFAAGGPPAPTLLLKP